MIATLKAMNRPSPLRDPDVRLMLRVKRDDAQAFQTLLDRHSRTVFQQLYHMLGNPDDAEDLTQEVFLRVFRHRRTYTARAKFVTWLYHIVRNVGRNAIRDRRRHPTVPLFQPAQDSVEHEGLVGVLADRRAEEPGRPLERLETRNMLRLALGTLGRRQREAIELQQFADQSYAEIAHQLALTPQAAKSLLYRARLELRAVLEPYGLAE